MSKLRPLAFVLVAPLFGIAAGGCSSAPEAEEEQATTEAALTPTEYKKKCATYLSWRFCQKQAYYTLQSCQDHAAAGRDKCVDNLQEAVILSVAQAIVTFDPQFGPIVKAIAKTNVRSLVALKFAKGEAVGCFENAATFGMCALEFLQSAASDYASTLAQRALYAAFQRALGTAVAEMAAGGTAVAGPLAIAVVGGVATILASYAGCNAGRSFVNWLCERDLNSDLQACDDDSGTATGEPTTCNPTVVLCYSDLACTAGHQTGFAKQGSIYRSNALVIKARDLETSKLISCKGWRNQADVAEGDSKCKTLPAAR